MRLLVVAGILLIVAGGYLLINGGSITTQRDVLRLGDVAVSAEKQHPVQPWMAGIAIVAGIGLVAAGLRRKA